MSDHQANQQQQKSNFLERTESSVSAQFKNFWDISMDVWTQNWENSYHIWHTVFENTLQRPIDQSMLFSFEQHPTDPLVLTKCLQALNEQIIHQPDQVICAYQKYNKAVSELCQQTSFGTKKIEQVSKASETYDKDKRFKHTAWTDDAWFAFLKESYGLWSHLIKDVVASAQTKDHATNHKIRFYAQQLSDALSPNNFIWGNPDVLQKARQTNGHSLVKGFQNFLKDCQDGQLKISMVNRTSFKVGQNIAATPGVVVFQNDLFQLIHYVPTTAKVYTVPLLLVPPCINKFYIFDLQQKNSFVKWVLDQGFSTFIISWINPDQNLGQKKFEDYVCDGVGQAVDVIQDICQVRSINAVGFCIGGNFLVSYAAYLAAQTTHKHKNSFNTLTYFATLFDFRNAGDLKVFIDEEQVNRMEKIISQKGYLDGSVLAQSFNLLRSNDLIWSFVINNYLLGNDPLAFDLLFWNSDYTNLPAAMYLFYLKKCFLENKLIQPGGLTIREHQIDIGQIKTPSYVLSTRDDHIAPWSCGYAGAQTFAGPTEFVLGGSGHIAGIFNHPNQKKYEYWTHDHKDLTPEAWIENAIRHPGSWWSHWQTWMAQKSGRKIKPNQPGDCQQYPSLEVAPGSYVLK